MVNLKLDPVLQISPRAFKEIVALNPNHQFELTATGELVVMSPTGGETGERNDEISFQLRRWHKETRLGKTFNAATGFNLPGGGIRSPDASWLSLSRWEALTSDERVSFPPLCPDFVVELRSPCDNLGDLRSKMQEYIDNGALLAWLIDPNRKIVEIYRTGGLTEVLLNPSQLSGENVLPGFVLDLEDIIY